MLDKREPHAKKSFHRLNLGRMPGLDLDHSPFRTPHKSPKYEGEEEMPPNTADFIM
jgi:hypothetical protein